jgi:hypothetical protein
MRTLAGGVMELYLALDANPDHEGGLAPVHLDWRRARGGIRRDGRGGGGDA